MELIQQIADNRKKFRVDHFDLVISEYINRYKENKLILNPPYQRKFRWDIETQSALLESILIGIPLPPIFIFSNNKFEWEIIDGLQRTTTLINFLTNKKDVSGNPFRFNNCQILTGLNGKAFIDLPDSLRNSINNARIRIELVEDTDDAYSQYLLFSRLNNNGEALSHQELRNFLIYKLNPDFYQHLTTILKDLESYKSVMQLPEDRIKRQDDIEYIVRFFICRKIMCSNNIEDKNKYNNIENILTSEIQEYLKGITNTQLVREYAEFRETFDYINQVQSSHGYKSFGKGLNSLPNTSVIAPAISMCISYYRALDINIAKRLIEEFYASPNYKKITKQSYSPVKRFFELSLYAYKFFNDYQNSNS